MAQFFDENSFFRAMTPDVNGLPQTGRSARMLGVRIPEDIAADEKGFVNPETGGMSVSPNSAWNIPPHRRPRGVGKGSSGRIDDCIYSLMNTALPIDKLIVRLDPEYPLRHAFVEPAIVMPLAGYESELAATRNDWKQVWP
jgi:hypothetical protein